MQAHTTTTIPLMPISPQLREKKSFLGKDANIVATRQSKGKYKRFYNLSFAQHLLIENNVKSERSGNIHRTRLCHAVRSSHADVITLKISNSDSQSNGASLSGVQTCGSVWACPVCSARIAMQRGKEIGYVIDEMIKTGHIPLMMTNTASHKKDTHLPTFIKKFGDAWRMFTQSRKWRNLKNTLGIKHSIKAIEATHTRQNGFHHHQHGILFAHADKINSMKPFQVQDWQASVTELWLHCLDKNGLSGSKGRALDIQMSGDVKKDYLSKLGLLDGDTTNLDYELTAGRNKTYKGRNIWQILQSARLGNEADAKLYIQYVQAYDGKNWITYSRGLKDLVNLEDMPDEEVAEEEEIESTDYQPLIDISDVEYAPVRHYRAYGELLTLASKTRNADVIKAYLVELREKYNATDAGLAREKMLAQYTALDNQLTNFRLSYNRMKVQPELTENHHNLVKKWKSLRRQLNIR